MSNLPPNPYDTTSPQMNANPGTYSNHNQPLSQVPLSQLPPGYGGQKQDANSNSPLPPSSTTLNHSMGQLNNYSHSASSSPAFNHPGMMSSSLTGHQSSPMRPPMKPPMAPSPIQNLPPSSVSPAMARVATTPNSSASTSPYPPNTQQRQINDNAPPLTLSSQSLVNGPSMVGPPASFSQPTPYPPSSNAFAPMVNRPPPSTAFPPGLSNPPYQQGPPIQGPSIMKPPGPTPMTTQANVPFSGPPQLGPHRNSPLMSAAPPSGPPTSVSSTSGPLGSAVSGPPFGSTRPIGVNGPNPLGPPPASGTVASNSNGPPGMPTVPSGQFHRTAPPEVSKPPTSQAYAGPHNNGPPGLPMGPSRPPLGGPLNPLMAPPTTQGTINQGPAINRGLLMNQSPGNQGPPINQGQLINHGPPINQGPPISHGPPMHQGPPMNQGPQIHQGPPMNQGPPYSQAPPMNQTSHHAHMGQKLLPMGPSPVSSPPEPASGPQSNIPGRYPQMPQTNYSNHQLQTNLGKPPYAMNAQSLNQQMSQLSVTKQGFDQLWGHQMLDLMTCRQILPEYLEDPPEIRLGHQFSDAPNCSPEIFRCTVNKIPDTNSLLQKSRLPLGILIHPFKDLNHLPVIQCTTIVRCRACRTYINPFVYFVDAKRWKCNLCYRVNDLPEEFQYDPVSKSYGDPSRRPEIKSATIEFIAPGEYMLRPPQPAVYLFLLDVSQLARDSGYLQVVCNTLKNNLDQLPGDARTQVGFICFDAHVHYYLMSDGLTRPKEMTVIDVDDVFLPSPESLLVNLGERRELIKELLTVLPQRHSGLGVSACALGAALQAAYKLMAPTGGRVTVFQTCLPNVGPGALQPREDPNARSGSEVPHLAPATDFYKRLALDCSGAQVAVDLFLLNSQYADLASLSGMSKFSAGTVYHLPLFKASRQWQADQLTRIFTRYLTRKIGFEAVMRVRCTRGIGIHTFHGNFFVRSTDLLSLPNVSPDAGFGMQLTIEESLSDLQQVCFQAALLYTSSKGERRIRVHTLALPVATNLTDVLHSADQQCIIGLLSKMAVDRCTTASVAEAREALVNVAVDVLAAHRLAQNLPTGSVSAALHAPHALRLLPLFLLALLKRKAFRTGTSTRLDDRLADMCAMKSLPLPQLMRAVYPDLYPVHALRAPAPAPAPAPAQRPDDDDEPDAPDPPRLHLSAERINANGAYLLDDGETMIIYVCHAVSPAFLSETFGVAAFSQLPDEARSLPRLDTEGNALLHTFIDKLNDDRPYAANILVLRDNSPSRVTFTERLVDDRVESSFAYYEFLQHIKLLMK
ncbi:protein transport protein Sec24A [Hyposmocoma kahamanoa]|uniref:protein transport protein Sec24A n=1 Tax=Hyposmocoma kahamanoa TaxID=1477025 RepID=UPI000E6D684E|nr:protein transport protein Sec24A [Hyposmocoma kahamanoa]